LLGRLQETVLSDSGLASVTANSDGCFALMEPEKSAFVVGNCDFELKNGSGFWGRGFIAGASYGHLEILQCNILCYILEGLLFRKSFEYKSLYKFRPM